MDNSNDSGCPYAYEGAEDITRVSNFGPQFINSDSRVVLDSNDYGSEGGDDQAGEPSFESQLTRGNDWSGNDEIREETYLSDSSDLSDDSSQDDTWDERQRQKKPVTNADLKKNYKKVKHELDNLKTKLESSLKLKVNEMVDNFMAGFEEADLPRKLRVFIGDVTERKRKKSTDGRLPDKEFHHRNSLLTHLLEINHIQTIYHIGAAILVILFLNTAVCDLFDKGMIDYDFKTMQWAFGDLETVLLIWIGMMFTTSVVVYSAFYFWATKRETLTSNLYLKLWDGVSVFSFIVYLVLFFVEPVRKLVSHQLAPASAAIIVTEQVRMVMKTYSFIRENVPVALRHSRLVQNGPTKNELKEFARHEGIDGPCPDFGKYLYFLFAPTLIYRHRYPRTSTVLWGKVFNYFAQVVGTVFYVYFIFARFCVPVFQKFGQEAFTLKSTVSSVFGCMMPGTLALVITFYSVLHAWLNGFAEMLRFGDRMFYDDWWNSSTYTRYYRTWNVVVHDWLYIYIYKDIYELRGQKSKVFPKLMVFVISSIVHEYIIGFTMGFFYPVLFFLFGGFGLAFSFFNNSGARFGNIFLWATLFMGTGVLMSLYSMEFYAQINCPPTRGWLNWVPRSWTCYAASSKA